MYVNCRILGKCTYLFSNLSVKVLFLKSIFFRTRSFRTNVFKLTLFGPERPVEKKFSFMSIAI